MLAVTLIAVLTTRVPMAPAQVVEASMEPRTSRDEPLPVAGPMVAASARTASSRGSTGYLVRAAVPRTEDGQTSAPEATAQPQPTPTPEPLLHSYVVQEGDTVLGLARRYGITPETILSANSKLANDPDLLQLGEEIQIPAISGVLHVVAAGDTLRSIAERYKVGVEAIIGYAGNGLVEPYVLQPGQAIMVPGGEWVHQARSYDSMAGSPTTEVLASPTGSFVWPTTGTITQGCWAGHVAIDIGTASGTPIYASDAGYVTESGWSPVGYGQYVVIEHGNGFRTLYAHMSQRLVSAGETVAQGQRIGLVGSTGNSTGPHLHFEIYRNGVLQNPLNYLP